MKVWQEGSGWKQNARFKTWFHQVLVNRCLDWQHGQKRGQTHTIAESDFSEDQIESLLFAKEKKHYLKLALASFEPKERAALILHYHQGVPQHQVADILGISIHALETLLYRVRRQLYQRLSKLMIFSPREYREYPPA